MTDAKGLSEQDVEFLHRHAEALQPPLLKKALFSYDALAERLKACEEEVAGFQRWLSGGVYFTNDEFVQHVKEADAIKADLERARADYARLQDTVAFNEKAYLAEHGNWGACKWKQSNERLKAVLVGIGNFAKAHHLEQERDSHLWLHALIVDIPSMVEAGLTDTPETINPLAQELADVKAELARMKADPEILVRWQAAEAQRAWEATQS